MVPGTPVEVSESVSGAQGAGYAWSFRAHALNTTTGSEWLELIGIGRENYGQSKAVKADKVVIIPPPEPRIKTCTRCGRVGNKLFVKFGEGWACKNREACAKRRTN